MVWWIASWAEDEQLQGMNSLVRRGALVLGECGGFGGMDLVQDHLRSPITDFPLWWWLVLYIEARVLFPNIRWEGIPQWPI